MEGVTANSVRLACTSQPTDSSTAKLEIRTQVMLGTLSQSETTLDTCRDSSVKKRDIDKFEKWSVGLVEGTTKTMSCASCALLHFEPSSIHDSHIALDCPQLQERGEKIPRLTQAAI